jgi:hypothetical protein
MKKAVILSVLILLVSVCRAQSPTLHQDSIMYATITLTPDTTLLSPSYYLQRAAKKQTQELLWAGGGGLLCLVGVGQESDGSGRSLCFIGATVCGVVAIIKHIGAVHNLKLAGRSLERVHFQQGGIAIDL